MQNDGRDFLRRIQPGEITEGEARQLAAAGCRYYDTTGSMSKLVASTVNGQPALAVGVRKRAEAAGGIH